MVTNKLNNQQMELLDQEDDVNDDFNFEQEDEDENLEPFDPTKIRVKTKPMTMDLLLKRIEYDEIDLAPDFQRQSDIWTLKAKSRLIESLLIRIPLPAFYIDATNDDKWIIIDGLQRISTFKSFILDKALKLTGLQFLTDLEKNKYDDLPRHYQRRIDETELTVYLIEPGTPSEVKYNIFERVNTGGLPLNPQELRQAMNPGQAIKILKKLANLPEFERVTTLSKKKKQRMDDHEFILGFIAFTLNNYEEYPVRKGRKYFLHEAMKQLNKIDSNLTDKIVNNFTITMKTAYNIFGDSAFRKSQRSPVNKSLFEAWSVSFSKLNSQEIDILINHKEILKEKFIEKMQKDNDFNKSISQAASKVKYRFEQINQIVQEVLLC
ncbi:DUF262 domain-containing protein [Anabaena cylindrica FACHB-243]|uniref:GmrSD restriction endonucleases N-terminal domain-containing protein n=1 Tax=Anabaena cylindrica (strain ATCC 27899 / PCC 7122) TaxID=272123 RepID=K9ZBH6_ANACC|nr:MULTISPECIES: DUF262 domain-containing protein [Anabaena]AFZ55962.1 protein of unknown function DUF262 [Anabaena cylindrica PCC 7122]MBD2421382.1 DUF262 domain-containing protein [Anabaena cylindrica FACHB-243]MBY5284322.1 DUF262 domain-containing protein [Anabaena sp. CCAP 1446/1C]MBY5306228.1 DUF262 domain-containing protein [Anabaena sp. CCAP 1446/1C]MCM2406715.1 DUF262 domain-containing protein [Anabaena sp. CCAP 1446/1C]